jgi:hypothetical protein
MKLDEYRREWEKFKAVVDRAMNRSEYGNREIQEEANTVHD